MDRNVDFNTTKRHAQKVFVKIKNAPKDTLNTANGERDASF